MATNWTCYQKARPVTSGNSKTGVEKWAFFTKISQRRFPRKPPPNPPVATSCTRQTQAGPRAERPSGLPRKARQGHFPKGLREAGAEPLKGRFSRLRFREASAGEDPFRLPARGPHGVVKDRTEVSNPLVPPAGVHAVAQQDHDPIRLQVHPKRGPRKAQMADG